MSDRILYIDDHIAVIVKKAGEICEHQISMQSNTKLNTTEQNKNDSETPYIPEKFMPLIQEKLGHAVECVECVHRLDRPVSGVEVLALTKAAATVLSTQFASHDVVRKSYWAIVEGIRDTDIEPILLSCHMIFNPSKQRAYIVDATERKAKKAELKMRCTGHGDRYSFIDVELLTGRTHQIRVQLASLGMPVKGDVKYGARRADTLPGIRLLSSKIEFIHPVTHKKMAFIAPLPAEDPLWCICAASMSNR